jgi:protein TonB
MLKAEQGSRVVNHNRAAIVKVVLLATFVCAIFAVAQVQETSSTDRRLITRVEPDYPETLKRLYIGGVVRVEVEVEPNGTIKSTKLLGGNPILGQSTMKALKKWKYAPAGSAETLTVKVEFDAHR